MRSPAALLFACLLLVLNVRAQSPDSGHIQGDAYINSYFHISYSWPKILTPYDTASLNLPHKSPYNNEFLLFSARQGDQPHGVVLMAERLNTPTPHSRGIKDAAQMMDMLIRFNPEQHVVIQSKKHFTSENGFVFDELDYTENGTYSSALITPEGNFLLLFKCDAQSAADLAKMITSAVALGKID